MSSDNQNGVDPKNETLSVPLEQMERLSHWYVVADGGPKGRGLFAVQNIPPRTLVHVAPCLSVTKEEYECHMKYTILEHYLFNAQGGNKLLALGDGSLFNHANRPNVDYRIDSQNLCIRYYVGHEGIKLGQELCISYGAKLWFDDADGHVSSSSSEDDEGGVLVSFLSRMEL
jgi:SET domain-containing protein